MAIFDKTHPNPRYSAPVFRRARLIGMIPSTHILRLIKIGFCACVLGAMSLHAQQQGGSISNSASQAAQMRQQDIVKTQQTMLDGDRLHAERDYAGALELYRAAFLNAPGFKAANQVRLTAFQKYQDTLPLVADAMAKQGRSGEALALVDQFFKDAIAEGMPVSAVSRETRFLAQDLKSGEKYEPALSPQHLEKKQHIELLFPEAQASMDLGNYDRAKEIYNEILSVDPYNSAARNGLNRVEQLITTYQTSAYNQTRATMLGEVAAAWANPVPRYDLGGLTTDTTSATTPIDEDDIATKLQTIILPAVEFENTPLREAIDFLVYRSRALDTRENNPAKQGVNILISNEAQDLANVPITLSLTQVPLGEALRYVTEIARAKVRIDQFAVLVVPLTYADDTNIITMSYRVPPSFLSNGSLGGGGGGDPFGGDPFGGLGDDTGSTLQAKLTAQEYLEQNGIPFPPGASAKYIPSSSTLLVRNTQPNISLIEALVDSSFQSVEKLLKIDVRLLDVTDEKLKIFGFDWLLGQFNLPGSNRVFGSGGTLGSTSSADVGSSAFPFVPPGSNTPVGQFPVTSGLRFNPNDFSDSVNSVLGDRSLNSDAGAGAVFAISGVFSDPQFQVVLRALEQNMADDLSTAASVITRPGQIASVRNVREFIYPTEYDPPEIPDEVNNNVRIIGAVNLSSGAIPITPAHPTAFETREVGNLLEVEGSVSEDNTTISLSLTPEITQFEGFINYGSPIRQVSSDGGDAAFQTSFVDNTILMPVFRAIREQTSVTVYDGQTIVIGGLVNESRGTIHDKVPILGDTPVLGHLFRSEIDSRRRQSMLFFVTVNVIDPSGAPLRETANN